MAQNVELSNNLDIIKGVYYAFASGDFPAFLNALDPRIEWNKAENIPYADGNPYKGPEAVIRAKVTHMWTLKAGKITSFQQYTDTLQITQVMVG